ncbi:MAG: flagellar hook-basal body complex protein FliE [Nitrososphaerota archaeon]|jgi:dephospho-CoA kinase|uniref:AAA family ATPase n=1 Tax=Candidatus Bathycorpusculum sp. TaxID=2994959 RepID=UPI00281A8825|nr:flagellar hook-basal body complex protein FliE [Candidatus Termiticorpusculum sp.]MCL2257420.1 flagellar hook-basal body complex protein FliE [Candidatus Termiticorpusculum sp.]MCL2292416.1 flagellar hook-basal body complex protein FliE [Candidatus Termiticorpusculum sp.]MDR0460985.1 flagellar hook-basal body complex protein FliE [Nitrososphaerota archaeon]
MNVSKLVIGLTGMPGAGKTVFVETAKTVGYVAVSMGDVVREETQRRGLELNPQNVGMVMLDLRSKGGSNVIAERCVPKIETNNSDRIVIDGLRSLNEVAVFKAHFAGFKLVAVHAASVTRFARLSLRGRSDDPKTFEVFYERDMRELSVGLGNAIALSDHVTVNNGGIEVFNTEVKKYLEMIEATWTP